MEKTTESTVYENRYVLVTYFQRREVKKYIIYRREEGSWVPAHEETDKNEALKWANEYRKQLCRKSQTSFSAH